MIGDKAEAADRPEVYTGRDITGIYELNSLEEIDCDEISEEGTFPELGEFIECHEVRPSGEVLDELCYVSWYADLDRQLAQLEPEVGMRFEIAAVREKRNGGYQMDVTRLDGE